MSPSSLSDTRNAFLAFREECIWLQTIHNTFGALFNANQETSTLLTKTAPLFFAELNSMFIEYWILIVCRLTDQPQSRGRENLTVKNLLEHLKALNRATPEIERAANGIQIYRSLLRDARNRAISHADKKTFLDPALLGEHKPGDITEFLQHLHSFNDLVGEAVGEGPLDFKVTAGPGDVYDLLRILRDATA